MIELLAPAGNTECATAAINNGADAIYLGYSSFSARQSADNFDTSALCDIIQKAHFCGVKVYVAMNTIVKDVETEEFLKTLLSVWKIGADAIIMQDVFLGRTVHEKYPEIILHLSTQAGICSSQGARFAKECGFSRVILARETPLDAIAKVSSELETEVFVQGALCTCFSGQCYFSSFAGGNSGNRGRCKQPCRKLYAYDRNGNTEKNYALSLSDLCVGEEIEKLIRAGVVSFKIEGRMRRPEYVAAAVRYYRMLLDKSGNDKQALSDLKRTYNRGNYTKGLAFGQDKRFLSVAVQGHIGEKVGVVKVTNGKFFVESIFKPRQGDAFKILRDGKEVGGAVFVKTEGRGFFVSSKIRLKNGDGVFVTTDTAVNERVFQTERREKLSLRLYFHENEPPVAECGLLSIAQETPLQSAQKQPLTEADLKTCFSKTDGLPLDVMFEKVDLRGNIFIPKSQLNAFRRSFFEALSEKITERGHKEYSYQPFKKYTGKGKNEKTAVISNDFTGIQTDIAIYKPDDYAAPVPESFLNGSFQKYLYFPPFYTQLDVNRLYEWAKAVSIDGLYVENYGGMVFARELGVKIFAGTGLNIINGISLAELLKDENVAYYVVSKEANAEEATALIGENAFVLSSGDVKIMDLCYCPFGKTCGVCDKKSIYTLTDEGGRSFPVRRYIAGDGSCRFEVYNCANLVGKGLKGAGKLIDLSVTQNKRAAFEAKDNEDKQKQIYKTYTSGHFKRGVL